MNRLILLHVTAYLIALSGVYGKPQRIETKYPNKGTATIDEDFPDYDADENEIPGKDVEIYEIQDIDEELTDLTFYLYTSGTNGARRKLSSLDPSSLLDSEFMPGAKTVFITHGFRSSSKSEACTLIRDAYLRNPNFNGNVIVIDWSYISTSIKFGVLTYTAMAAFQVQSLGERVGQALDNWYNNRFIEYNDTILVGHSLGAHLMGIAGYAVKGQVKAIFGLDPAGPSFVGVKPGHQITSQSAQYVQLIHTNQAVLGSIEMLGHVDFVLNAGHTQPGCNESIGFICAHSRAYEYFAESINSERGFWGKKCDPISDLVTECNGEKKRYLGGLEPDTTDLTNYEVYGVKTKGTSPFALGKDAGGIDFTLYWRHLMFEKFMKTYLTDYVEYIEPIEEIVRPFGK